jgi:UDP-N-acetylmuramoyl-L-alanyl-D-glutamate--2,6-diaminopimelate ligase
MKPELPENAVPRRLSELLEGLAVVDSRDDRDVRGLTQDSRKVERGWLFLALPGLRVDGRRYIAEAAARGASAVVYEPGDAPELPAPGIPMIALERLQWRAGVIADRFFGSPSRRMRVVGVTGTNGKTTCSHLLAQALSANGSGCGLIGTLGAGLVGALDKATHTTPDAVSVHGLLARFAAQGAEYVCMEVSSHALDQGRVAGVVFDTAVFTNLSQDHLDYHGDMANYFAVKTRLFAMPGLQRAVINADDEYGRELLEMTPDSVSTVSYGLAEAEVCGVSVVPQPHGLTLQVRTPDGEVEIDTALIGRFNAYNLLAVLAALLALGVPLIEAAARLARVRPVAGRMECFGGDSRPLVVVDYAHSPDALEKALAALREHVRERLFCVFGCGGNRDRGKRPQMGRIAETLADVVVLTDDNPRFESPEDIVAEIRAGMRGTPEVIHDRVAAIRWAVDRAGTGDAVLVAGKGHEETQQIGDRYVPMSDRRIVSDLLGLAA